MCRLLTDTYGDLHQVWDTLVAERDSSILFGLIAMLGGIKRDAKKLQNQISGKNDAENHGAKLGGRILQDQLEYISDTRLFWYVLSSTSDMETA